MDLTGQKLGKYELVERLGQGGMAEVYKAFQPGVERFVAIKVMHPHLAESDDFVARFQREAKAVGQLQHTHIMRIIDFDVQDENYYMVMEFIDGEDLEDYMRKAGGKMPASTALRITDELAGALAYAHERDMIHRDIKPANIMSHDTQFSSAILMDFGIARLLKEGKMTMTGSMIGTPAYMSPEAVKGLDVDERTDIYSLGVVLYEMVTGRTPYVSDTPFGLIAQQMTDPIPEPQLFNPDIPEQISRILMKALAKDVSERYQSAKAFQTAVRHARMALGEVVAPQVLDVTPSDALRAQAARQVTEVTLPPGAKRNRWGYGIAGILLLLIAGIFIINSFTNGDEPVAEVINTPTATTTAPVSVVPEATATNVVVTNVATAVPTVVAPTATTPALVENIEPNVAQQTIPAGFLSFSDNGDTRGGTFSLELERVPLLPPTADYVLKVRETGESPTTIALGTFTPNLDNTATFTLETSTNLFTDFGVFEVNMIDNGVETPMFVGLQDAGFVVALRELLFLGRKNGLLLGAQAQTEVALENAGILLSDLENGNLANAKTRAEHIVNILDGTDGADFGDLNQDGQIQNAGDGVGVRTYLAEAQDITFGTFANYGGAGNGDLLVFTLAHADEVRVEAQALALKIFATDIASEAMPFAQTLEELLTAILTGQDVNGDGMVDPNLSEGGLAAAYDQALAWGAVKMNPINPSLQATGIPQDALSYGTLQVVDLDGGQSNAFVLTANGLLMPAFNQVYEAWLLDNAGIPTTNLTDITLENGAINATGFVTDNIIENYSGLIIARQPAGETTDIPTDIAYRATFTTDLLPQFRTLLASDSGLFSLAQGQLDLAIQHSNIARNAFNNGDFEAGRNHAEHVVNILAGEESEQFGDLNGDGQAQNPGDDYGLNFYMLDIGVLLDEIVLANALAPAQQFAAARAVDTSLHHFDALNQALAQALFIFDAATAAEAQPFVNEMIAWLEEVNKGADLDDNGVVDPLFLEGGLADMVRFAQKATMMEIRSVE